MARIVLGLGSSHTPMASTPSDKWYVHAERDKANPTLVAIDGVVRSYHDLLERADPRIERDELRPSVMRERYEAAQTAIQRLEAALDEARPDVMVIIGDDQGELFAPSQMPALSVFSADAATVIPPDYEAAGEWLQVSGWGWYPEKTTNYPCQGDLGRHLTRELVARGFDLALCSEQPRGTSLGHAYSFVERRIIRDRTIPIVPIFLNGFFPPNCPTSARSYDLGCALRQAIESWDGNSRVAIYASGGMTHLVINQELDRAVIAALEKKDRAALTAVPEPLLQYANGETKNWIAAGGAMEHLQMTLVDYIPAYRSPAGTGVGMAFATWQ
ncbi:MAG: hypothetical protein U0821_03710 [Chloroflexota bacterium]